MGGNARARLELNGRQRAPGIQWEAARALRAQWEAARARLAFTRGQAAGAGRQ